MTASLAFVLPLALAAALLVYVLLDGSYGPPVIAGTALLAVGATAFGDWWGLSLRGGDRRSVLSV